MTSNLILYFIVVYGISFMFVYSNGPFHIFLKLREYLNEKNEQLSELFNCMFCFPTNVGWIMSLFNSFILTSVPITPFHILWGNNANWFWVMLFDMCVTGAVVYLFDTIQTRLEGQNNGEY